ncbi:RHS repeat-associated core domain-containing protein [Anoxybacillus rupiensis]|uniref:RHS repeat-associated core domain-containing protein n=1 Tax=Anoxybacteroides rupiense TaxID=311460 RepID=A0ABT5W6N5_9BACL|nr:RHS repeat-associated core domain-containing protein [Anoxybacillus rupiensis]MDE8564982.1 RHS repeat-associated core domain-containing protein [Anoxybacillus rupiensis]
MRQTDPYYLIARYYHPTHGVFLSMDPDPGDADDILTQNGYTYANNNPVMLVDPDEHFVWMAINAGFAAYDGYKAFKKGGWKAAAIAVGVGLVGGVGFKAGKVLYRAYKVKSTAKKMRFDSTAFKHMQNRDRYVPRQILARAIVYGKKSKDGAKGYNKYTVAMHKLEKARHSIGDPRNYKYKKYKLTVVYNKRAKRVRHFHYEPY